MPAHSRLEADEGREEARRSRATGAGSRPGPRRGPQARGRRRDSHGEDRRLWQRARSRRAPEADPMANARTVEAGQGGSIANPVAVIVVCAIGLTCLGLTILFSASVSLKQDPYFYLNKQVAGVAAACFVCFVASRINLDYARRASGWIAGIALPCLLVLIPHLGVSVKGAAADGWDTEPPACRCPSSRSWRWCSASRTISRSTRPGSGT